MKRWYLMGLMFALLAVPALRSNDTRAVAEDAAPADKRLDLLEELAMADQLAAFGRGEIEQSTGLKGFKSPAALVAAGGIYFRANKATGGKVDTSAGEVVDQDGKPVPASDKATNYGTEAESLFDEARAIAGNDAAEIESLIKQAQTAPERGAVGGPRVVSRTVPSGKTHSVTIPFEPGAPGRVCMKGTGIVQFEVINPKGKVIWHSKGNFGTYCWNVGARGEKDIRIKIINRGGPAVAYTISTN